MPSIPPTSAQLQSLLHLLANALLELRALGWSGAAQQAGDLANALHNLPTALLTGSAYDWTDTFATLAVYEQRYEGKTMFAYAEAITNIRLPPDESISF